MTAKEKLSDSALLVAMMDNDDLCDEDAIFPIAQDVDAVDALNREDVEFKSFLFSVLMKMHDAAYTSKALRHNKNEQRRIKERLQKYAGVEVL